MRKLAVVLIVLILAAGGGYYSFWHKQADVFKARFVEWADSLNKGAKAHTPDIEVLHYDSVSVTGFPTTMILEISKPVVTVPVSAIVKEARLQKGDMTALPFEWVEQASWADKATVTGSIWGDHYTLSFYGDHSEKSLINKTPRHNLIISSSPWVMNLGVEQPKGGTPWTMQPIFTDPQTFLAIFRSFTSDVKSVDIKDAGTNSSLYSVDNLSTLTSNEPAASNHKLAWTTDIKQGKATPAFDAVYHDYLLMYYTLMGTPEQLGDVFPASAAGAQDLKVDIRYDGPTEAAALADPGMNLHFDINAFNGHSALNDMAFEMHLSTVPQGNDRSMALSMHGKSTVTPEYDQLMQKYLASVLRNAAKADTASKPATDPGAQFMHKIAALGNPDDVLAKVYPQFHTLGETKFDLDLNIKGPNNPQKFFQQSVATLDDLDWAATPYGVKFKGNANASTPGKMPTGELSFTCIACDALVNDAGSYGMRIEGVVNQLSTTPKPPFVTKDLIEAAKQFLHGIAENATASDVVVHLVVRDTGFTISGKQLPEVLALYMTTIAPHMPQPGSAGGQPEMSPPPGQ